MTKTVAGRYGAISGFGLSVVKWVLILKVWIYQTEKRYNSEVTILAYLERLFVQWHLPIRSFSPFFNSHWYLIIYLIHFAIRIPSLFTLLVPP